MSTFDGFVKEFPNIRIDYFRQHPSRPPPAACFLSHIHSDHLQGLETLKMPFVYCSATTRRLLLRMEKYPHRMNFAKGILESRKETYKHLKFVLRALPLQTSTEIELNPSSTIRITLFDANHCPGAVSFLIEGSGRAILYTGDVRAEPWWVNSLVQSPYILPYACDLRKIDCMYLDTTFASHDDVYKRFPSKAEGLKELIQKLSQFSDDTIFYFRAWTLGYEQVWITMSSLLCCQVHVDQYQMRLFSGIIENGRDGFSTLEGPALAGFTVGNEDHQGCLTTSSASRIHSCEPGTACHASLKERNVVWVTPIISRLDDGTELLEAGAGGGLGDLYQVPELDIGDITLQALASLCNDIAMEANSVKKLLETIAVAQQAGSSIALEGLGLDADAEISLKDFVRLLSGKGAAESSVNNGANGNERVVHFPYSRHSSYDELRHLVSVFRPKDICACTVDIAHWYEGLSMKSLFGDLCSEDFFYHDHEVRMEVEETKVARETSMLKRKRDQESQNGEEDEETQSEPEEVFVSAKGSSNSQMKRVGEMAEGDNRLVDICHQATGESRVHDRSRESKGKLDPAKIKQEFRKLNDGSDFITIDDSDGESESVEEHAETQISLTSSIFDTQGTGTNVPANSLQIDVAADVKPANRGLFGATSAAERKKAYNAAVKCLRHDDRSAWDAVNLRSVGRHGHSHLEMEL